MIDQKSMVLGLIPARKGSKGVPGKNIRLVCGKPIIVYAIECGLKVKEIDHLIVSTDSQQIAKIALDHNAEVPFIRPAEIASDTAPMLSVMQHAISNAERHYGKQVECLVLLDPTAPLRRVEDIRECLKIFRESDCDAVVSGNDAHRSPFFNMVMKNGNYYNIIVPTKQPIDRRQDSPEIFDLNTVVWIYSRKAIMEEKKRLPQKTLLYKVPKERAIDLDTEFDFATLDIFLKQ